MVSCREPLLGGDVRFKTVDVCCDNGAFDTCLSDKQKNKRMCRCFVMDNATAPCFAMEQIKNQSDKGHEIHVEI